VLNEFDLLFAIALFATGVSVVRARPATLILAANQAVTLRSLANIARYGKPVSQGYLADSLFAESNLKIALAIFTISVALTVVVCLLPKNKLTAEPATLPRLPAKLFWTLIVYFVIVFFSQKTFFTTAYGASDRWNYDANFGGATAFLEATFLYEIIRRTMTSELKRGLGFAIILCLFIGTDYLHGQTGLATGFVVVAATVIFSPERAVRRTLILGALLLGLLLLALSVRVLRSSFTAEHSQGVAQVAINIRASSANESSRGEGVESMGNGAQYACHVIECIELYEAGISRSWRSIYSPIVYTFEPSFLLGPLGITRPREAAWELGDYFIGGGGIFVIGELYWNGGYLCVALVFAGMAWLAWRCDSSYRSGFTWLAMSCNFSTNLLQGTGYGFAQVSRGLINGLLMLAIYAAVHRYSGAPRDSRSFASA
jgi:hypothetical protein